MADHSRYGVLLIGGAQTHQENYAPAFAADQRCRLIGLTDEPGLPLRRQGLNLKWAAAWDVPYLADFEAAISRPDVDIVCLCPEPERRARLAEKCVRAGKHVYLDKPPATRVEDAHRLVDAVGEAGVRSQMWSLVRTPLGERCRQILNSGQLGELVALHCELLFAKGPAGSADLSAPRTEKAQAERFTFLDSKRELFCVGLYPLVLFEWLTGRRVETVYATTANYFFGEHQRNDVEDFTCLVMSLSGGIEATITVGRTGWRSHPSHGVHQVHLFGSKDAVTCDAYRPRLEVYSDGPRWQEPARPHPEDPMGFWASTQRESGLHPKRDWWPVGTPPESDVSYFVDCIEQGRESDVSVSVGAHALEVILAGYQSAADGKIITIPTAV